MPVVESKEPQIVPSRVEAPSSILKSSLKSPMRASLGSPSKSSFWDSQLGKVSPAHGKLTMEMLKTAKDLPNAQILEKILSSKRKNGKQSNINVRIIPKS